MDPPLFLWLRRLLFGLNRDGYRNLLNRVLRRIAASLSPKRRHPTYRILPVRSAFDETYGVSTAGVIPWSGLRTGSAVDPYLGAYMSSPPSVIRAVINRLPDPERFSFIDIGCGKGRALVIASERPFKAIIGIDIVPALCDVARENARVVATRHPERTRIDIVCGDASRPELPPGDLVLYLFHPFWKPTMAALITGLEAALARESRRLIVIYNNPVLRRLLDRSPALAFDESLSCIIPPDDERTEANVIAVWRERPR